MFSLGLEPRTFSISEKCADLLRHENWKKSEWRVSNPRPPGPKPGALPTALHSVKLPVKDSNLGRRVQSAWCCRYTNRDHVGRLGVEPSPEG